MAIQTINIGSSANKGDGDPLRTAFKKINENFAELDTTNTIRDIKGSVFGDDSTLLVDGVNNLIPSSVLSGSLPAIDGSALTGITATTLGGQNASYYLDYTNFTNTPTIFSGAFADLTSKPTTLAGYGITDATSNNDPAFTGAVDFTGATSIDFNTVTINNLDYSDISNTPTLFSGAYGDLTGAPTDISTFNNDSGYLTSVPAQSFASLTGKPTTLAGYGITDAQPTLVSGTSIKTINGTTLLGSGDITISGGGAETDPIVGAITGIVKSDGAGNISAAVAGTDYSTFDGNYGSLSGTPTLFSGVFADLTSKPTTLAGYGITDALTLGGALTGSSLEAVAVGAGVADGNDLTITGGDATEINSTGGDANITGGSGALTSGNVNIGTTQTVAVSIGASGVGTSIGGTLTANGNAIFNTGVQEKFATLTGSTGVTAMDCDNGQVFYLTGAAGDITANFTNLGLTAEYGTNVTVIINQGATPYEVTAVQIGGSAQTIEWQGGSAPTGNANGIDSFSFTILRDGGSYVVLGQMVDFT